MTALRHLRKTLGLTQTDFAALIGVSQAVVSRLEAGSGELTIGAYERLKLECARQGVAMPGIPELLPSGGHLNASAAVPVGASSPARTEKAAQPAAGSA